MHKIVCFHLLNDYSGSPKVLRMVLLRLLGQNNKIDLITSNGDGALSDLCLSGDIRIYRYLYKFSTNPVIALIRYLFVQGYLFFFSFRYLFHPGTLFYINTILPVGAALAGRLMGKQVVYHYHENAFAKSSFYKLLAYVMKALATKIICVSNYQRSFLRRKKGVYIVPNAIPGSLIHNLQPCPDKAFSNKRVLILGSLKRYKGTTVFVRLAETLSDYMFELVLNETQENIDTYWRVNKLPLLANLTVYPRQQDVAPFYNRASIVLNLTDKNYAIETFGLTALEAMSVGLPVIVPTVGGIAEMVKDGENGYKIDIQDFRKIVTKINHILSEKALYDKMSKGALATASMYNEVHMCAQIESILRE